MSLILSSPFLPPSPHLPSPSPSPSSSSTLQLSPLSPRRINNNITTSVISSSYNNNNHHNSVDQSMIILRCRIHQLKTLEQSPPQPPSHWLPWEKHLYPNYDAIICHAIAHLQTFFMDTRPSFALSICLLLAFSLATSSTLLIHHFFLLLHSLLSSSS